MSKPTYYEFLGIAKSAGEDEIRKQYRALARKYHPDLQQNPSEKEKAQRRMVYLNAARDTLLNPQERSRYDEQVDAEARKTIAEKRSHWGVTQILFPPSDVVLEPIFPLSNLVAQIFKNRQNVGAAAILIALIYDIFHFLISPFIVRWNLGAYNRSAIISSFISLILQATSWIYGGWMEAAAVSAALLVVAKLSRILTRVRIEV